MGSFHCPIGAATRGTVGCVSCGLCIATTRQGQIEAANRMRAHIRSRTTGPVGSIRKIAVCGKGGVGKSTLVAMLAHALVYDGYRVMVVDTDESNPSLHRLLGIHPEPEPLSMMLERFAPDGNPAPKEWLGQDAITLDSIPEQYISWAGNLAIMCVGKIEDPLAGCACPMGSLTRELMMNLDPGEGDIVLVDLEAGIESFGRGMEQGADTVLVVTEPSLDSVLLSAKIRYMAEGLGIQRIRAILNKTRDPRTERRIRDMLIEHEVRYIGTMPHGEDVADASLEGTVPLEGASVENVRWLTGLLLDEAEMDHPITLHAVLEA